VGSFIITGYLIQPGFLVLPAFYYAIPFLMFLVVFWFLMNRSSLLLCLGGAYGIWIGSVLVVNRIVAVWCF
jgi:uncharacterized membrane protein (GlpM family)